MSHPKSEYKLVIAGDNPSQYSYVEYLHKLASGNQCIEFTGAVYGDDKEKLLKNAFCFCLPSSIEGLSIVMMEAASYKLPIIASDIEANKEFLGSDAIYIKPENTSDLKIAFSKAIESSELMSLHIKNNYQKLIDHYTWDKVALKYVDYLKSIGCH